MFCSESLRTLIGISLETNSRRMVYKLVLDISAKGWIEIFLTPGHNPGSSSQIWLSGADKSKGEPDKSIVTEISTFLCRSCGSRIRRFSFWIYILIQKLVALCATRARENLGVLTYKRQLSGNVDPTSHHCILSSTFAITNTSTVNHEFILQYFK